MNRRTQRVKDAEIYKVAAAKIYSMREHYSCIAIDNAVDPLACGTPQRRKYQAVFGNNLQIDIYDAIGSTDTKMCRGLRTLLLCFMAAMVEAGDA